MLQDMMSAVLTKFLIPHLRFHSTGINSICQTYTHSGSRTQLEFHEQTVDSLIKVMDDAANPRVLSHAAARIIKFCDEVTRPVIERFLERLCRSFKFCLCFHIVSLWSKPSQS